MISLTEAKRGERLVIKFVRGGDNSDLSAFGLVRGEEIKVIESGNSGTILTVGGRRIALDAATAASIMV